MPKGDWIVRLDVSDPTRCPDSVRAKATSLRQPVSLADRVVVEGYDGPQPG